MKYTQELNDKISAQYTSGMTASEIADLLSTEVGEQISERSVIAKLSHLGVYKKKEYLTKRGEVPIKKAEYIDMLAQTLEVDSESLESLEKVNKGVLQLLVNRLTQLVKIEDIYLNQVPSKADTAEDF